MDKNILNEVYRQLVLSKEESEVVSGGAECHCHAKDCTILCQSTCTIFKDCVSGGTLLYETPADGNLK